MHSLEKLAMMKAISDRSWLGCAMLFQQLTKGMAQMLLETCLEQKNTAAFEEFLLNLRQEKLVIRNNLHFNQEFAMLVANIIQKNRSFEATKITEIDFAGCAIGKYMIYNVIFIVPGHFDVLTLTQNYFGTQCELYEFPSHTAVVI